MAGTFIHSHVYEDLARYEHFAKYGMTRVTREEVEVALADAEEAENALEVAGTAAATILEAGLSMYKFGYDERYDDPKYAKLYDLTMTDVGWVKVGRTLREKFPLKSWAAVTKKARAITAKIERELARLGAAELVA